MRGMLSSAIAMRVREGARNLRDATAAGSERFFRTLRRRKNS
jgi:hypothetical protein